MRCEGSACVDHGAWPQPVLTGCRSMLAPHRIVDAMLQNYPVFTPISFPIVNVTAAATPPIRS
jgi:hypothetical protein